MKVKTDLKAGNLVTDTANLVGQTVDYATGFVANANQAASKTMNSVGGAAKSAWSGITGRIGDI